MKRYRRIVALFLGLVLAGTLSATAAFAADNEVLTDIGNRNGGDNSYNGDYNVVSDFLRDYGVGDGGNGNYNGNYSTAKGFLKGWGSDNGGNGSYNDSGNAVRNFLKDYGADNGGNLSENGSGDTLAVQVHGIANVNTGFKNLVQGFMGHTPNKIRFIIIKERF